MNVEHSVEPARQSSRTLQQQPGRSAAPGTDAGTRPPKPRLNSQQLFGGTDEIEIAHGDALYRLRITSLGKLILTK